MKPAKKQKATSSGSAHLLLTGSPGLSLTGAVLTADRYGPSHEEVARSVKTW